MTDQADVFMRALVDRLVALQLGVAASDGVFEDADDTRPAIFVARLEAAPVSAVALHVYDEVHDRDPDNPDIFVQFRFRSASADPTAVDSMAARTSYFFDWRSNHRDETWSRGVVVGQAKRVVRGVSELNGRYYERPDSFRFKMQPTTIGSTP